MKKLMVLGTILLLGSLIYLPAGFAQQKIVSERGDIPIDQEVAPTVKQWQPDTEPIKRDYVQQPPLIPHSVEGYQVDLKFNKCMSCHSWATYREAKATKISQTHFKDRDGNDLADVSARRYFCTQCHVPQMDAKPLVENTFKPVEAISSR
ncbi:MAG: nitrate reductase cytochrome c-type subunit [Gammaproteobacteria bacterium]